MPGTYAAVLGLCLTRLVGLLLRDMVLTRDEVDGLMAGLLTSGAAPTGRTGLGVWLDENADGLGREYVGELRRNYRPKLAQGHKSKNRGRLQRWE